MLFPYPDKKSIQEQNEEEKLLLKEITNDQPKKIKNKEELFDIPSVLED